MDVLQDAIAVTPGGLARQIHLQAVQDLKEILPLAQDLAAKCGLQAFGRPKRIESILLKWDRKGLGHPIHDATALTILVGERSFREDIPALLNAFALAGHQPVGGLGNYCVPGSRDSRFQQRMLSRATGRQWELQFRFESSSHIDNHAEFEIARDPEIPLYVARAAELRACQINALVVLPPGVLDLGTIRPFESVVRQ